MDFTGSWASSAGTAYSGGHEMRTVTANSDGSFTTTARGIAWVGARGTTRGTADVYVDGVLAAHVTMTSSTLAYRSVLYSVNFATSGVHTVRIVYTGPLTRLGDVDAFVALA